MNETLIWLRRSARRFAVNFVPRYRLRDERCFFLTRPSGANSPTAAGFWCRLSAMRASLKNAVSSGATGLACFSLSHARLQHGIFYIRERHAGH
jgi:hypothetical protein